MSIIIASYNNGKFLHGKGFASLQRSKMFDDMEIIIVDDGSTDEYTINIIKYLQKHFSNIKTFFYNDGGSGSSSRPRNKGIEMASSKYIGFMDPDNEIINDAFAEEYKLLEEKHFDYIGGHVIKNDKISAYYKKPSQSTSFIEKNELYTLIKGNKENLINLDFPALAPGSALLKKDIIKKNNLSFVPGAAGQDTLLGWEIFLNLNQAAFLNMPALVYYFNRDGSVVNNTKGGRYFELYKKIEIPKKIFLERENLLSEYMNRTYNKYIVRRDYKKLATITPEDRKYCTKLVIDMFNLYKEHYNGKSQVINTFLSLYNKGQIDYAFSFLQAYFAGQNKTEEEKSFKQDDINIRYVQDINKKTNKLILIFSGFGTYETPAKWNYRNTIKDLKSNKVFILDTYGCRGTYYIGSAKNRDVENAVTQLILHKINEFGAKKEDVICIGTSKGGTAALYYSIKLGLGHAYIGEPQIKIIDYLKNQNAIDTLEYLIDCGGKEEEKIINNLLYDVVDKNKQLPEIKIWLGKNGYHYNEHIKPFVDYINKHNPNCSIELKFGDYSEHNEHVKHFQNDILKELTNTITKEN